ncbi:hypothetical protein [Campylobacter vulpis]|uniref:hypothetical protein n=1 Tax=Campylobacter vulpis TaxID=1655500 RepID=UPI000C152056|nr:hypothetical protein [Campylobacter vulpis]MBS4275595.1 hypothetical protein [Campylobacter vulpis]MBS4306822.1 hypothetical protein [Campylobacter vulpis]MBS4329930.1 hypothetical protein [Campylobacter vulpis]MBS4423577.1 hypothetical protein [Campylobacter vulpis]PHY89920.1 hypothetical protein AA995_07215 [Campylobacter vulpis]
MRGFSFVLNLKAYENARLSPWELDKIEELLNIIEANLNDEAETFMDNFYSLMLSKNQFIYFKNFTDCFKEALREWVEMKARSTKLKNYDSKKYFWQETQILLRYFSKKAFHNLPSWAV